MGVWNGLCSKIYQSSNLCFVLFSNLGGPGGSTPSIRSSTDGPASVGSFYQDINHIL